MRIKLTKHQWERISELLSTLGVVSFVTFVAPFIFGETDIMTAIAGLVISLGIWYISIVIARKY